MEKYKTLEILQNPPNSPVFNLNLNSPSTLNALSLDFFTEFPKALSYLDQNPNVRVIILSGAGKHFCSGIDLKALSSIAGESESPADRGRTGEKLRRHIRFLQEAIMAIERCRKPVIASVHGACIGGGVDIVTACDLRFCCADAFFSVREVEMGLTADLGTLQRLPGIVGYGNAMELALTARRVGGVEAKGMGLVSRVFETKEGLDEGVRAIAEAIAAKSPLAVTGTKAILLKGRDTTMDQALDYVATWNSAMLLSDDLTEAISAHTQKRKPLFAKL